MVERSLEVYLLEREVPGGVNVIGDPRATGARTEGRELDIACNEVEDTRQLFKRSRLSSSVGSEPIHDGALIDRLFEDLLLFSDIFASNSSIR